MKILITGAAGFIGFHISNRLLELDHEILGIDNLNQYYDVQLKQDRLQVLQDYPNFKFHKIDISSNTEVLNDLIMNNNFDFIIHLAAQAGVRYSIENPTAYTDSNITGFLNVIESCKNFQNAKIIYASSSSVYGNNNSKRFTESQNTESQTSWYGVTKKVNELMAETFAQMYNIQFIGLRFFTVYGPWGRPDMAYYHFTDAIFNNKLIKLFNYGNHVRGFTYIDDVTVAIQKLVDYLNENDIENRHTIFNIGGDQAVPLKEFIEILEDQIGKKANTKLVKHQLGDVKYTASDNSKLNKFIQYSPSTDIKMGLSKFVNWYKEYYNIK